METATTLAPAEVQQAAVIEMMHRYAESVGLDRTQVYNPELKNWRWNKGSAPIEVFISRQDVGNGRTRDFLKVFSAIMQLPSNFPAVDVYRRLLELNDEKLGIKLTVQKGSNQIWGTFERDISGMDFEELNTFLYDFEMWSDSLDDMLKVEFPVESTAVAAGKP